MNDIFTELYELSSQGEHRKVIQRLISPRGRIVKPYSAELNHAWYLVGDAFYQMNEFREAVSAFKKALANSRDDIDAMMALANCHSELANPRLSVYYLIRAAELDQANDDLRYNLGNAYFDLGQYDKAISEYSRVKPDSRVAELALKNSRKAAELMEKLP